MNDQFNFNDIISNHFSSAQSQVNELSNQLTSKDFLYRTLGSMADNFSQIPSENSFLSK